MEMSEIIVKLENPGIKKKKNAAPEVATGASVACCDYPNAANVPGLHYTIQAMAKRIAEAEYHGI